MSNYTMSNGNYLLVPKDGSLPATHAPIPGLPSAVERAKSIGADVLLTGLLTGEVFSDDPHRELLDAVGWSILNPLETGEAFWRSFAQFIGYSSTKNNQNKIRNFVSSIRSLALPESYLFFKRTGLTEGASKLVEEGLRDTARRLDFATDTTRKIRLRPHLSQEVYKKLIIRESLNVPHIHANWLNNFLPHKLILGLPYTDRKVIELILSLPPKHRFRVGFGTRIDKFALRLAYAGKRLPFEIADRKYQAEIDAIPALFVRNNFEYCKELIGKYSFLYELGVVSEEFISSLTPENVHLAGDTVARMCATEKWLRGIA